MIWMILFYMNDLIWMILFDDNFRNPTAWTAGRRGKPGWGAGRVGGSCHGCGCGSGPVGSRPQWHDGLMHVRDGCITNCKKHTKKIPPFISQWKLIWHKIYCFYYCCSVVVSSVPYFIAQNQLLTINPHDVIYVYSNTGGMFQHDTARILRIKVHFTRRRSATNHRIITIQYAVTHRRRPGK